VSDRTAAGDTDIYGSQEHRNEDTTSSSAHQLNGNLAVDLPYNILINIFSCLSIRDLCMAEQGNTYFFCFSEILGFKNRVSNSKTFGEKHAKTGML
jgi:hypothetical protein